MKTMTKILGKAVGFKRRIDPEFRKVFLFSSAPLLFMVSSASYSATTIVSNSSEVRATLTSAEAGDVIQLVDGQYGRLNIKDIIIEGEPVHIVAENQHGATFENIEFRDSQNLTLSGVRVSMSADELYGIEILNSKDITVENSVISAADFNGGKNLYMHNTVNTLIKNNNISATTDGIHTTGELTNAVFDGNTIMLRDDAIPPLAHSDAFQSRSSPVQGLRISNNTIGYSVQNIFLQNIGDGPWQDIELIGNVSLLRGDQGFSGKHVALNAVDGLKIEGNSFITQSTTGDGYAWGIKVETEGEYTVKHNVFYNSLYLTPAQESDFNIFYNTTNKKLIGGYSDLDSYRAAFPYREQNSIQRSN